MSKLSKEEKFLDFSDYGRPLAKVFANQLKNTSVTPVQVTFLFGISGLLAIYCILNGFFIAAGFFLILKSVIDAADGELSRMKNTPSYTGRYLDSIFDNILNLLFILSICFVSDSGIWTSLTAFLCLQFQGTLYNYYYVILRHNSEGGDITSSIFESESPIAFPGEKQKTVNILFRIFNFLYLPFDRVIHELDKEAIEVSSFPKWFMSMVSLYGLGFQLLIMAMMLSIGLVNYIVPFFIGYSVLIFVFIAIRRTFLTKKIRNQSC
ncbi:CDP-alcohol phosphatidyltransferase family protein [Aquiflexum sp. LQ15W]|uniref:CDP-alcohol phosphatidyltransferase family protein n=1 Tax=Cognataquiflexum nitidum TaxID=2922272 RepID=UPI001F13AA4E|nr:CDP-alcohol phosphatidyltransferase family protein [Cognataquiflexum nitidum]MCH6197944.1 CDP-alcohol phosphatidyltransferase family protein [Cognataquiflexum nitidum]